ncbi:MAG: 4-alpha-glucanotransferase, partial [Clostridia bacterium]|nr:4-alpha-glucanotransferase [Clostridia bacterium]
MKLDRAGGVLLHPTSLPSPYGIGEIGAEAREFIDFLKKSGFKLWQILPLNPVGYGESP